MSRGTVHVDDRLADYLDAANRPETPTQTKLREDTGRMSNAGMQIGANQGSFMAFLVGLTGAKNCLEIGTFTGYSALAMAAALQPDGRLICCDVSREWTDIGRKAWEEAGVADRIELRLGPAAETLDRLIVHGGADCFDFAFIDADKVGYDGYYESCLQLLRPGGLIVLDNTLREGKVLDRADNADTAALQALNIKLRQDQRVDLSLLPISDGVTLARKR